MRIKLLALLLFMFPRFALSQVVDRMPLNVNYSVLGEILPETCKFKPVPSANELFWKQNIPEQMRNNYIIQAENFLGKSWDDIPNKIFEEYKTTGNRTNYENKSFALRRQMACLVMGEIMEYKGRFVNDIIKGLLYFQREVWWGIPAHYPLSSPIRGNQEVDLYNAETANLLAWSVYMLKEELDKSRPGVCEMIRKEIERRFLIPARTANYKWKTWTNNWNPWICSNWLSCLLFCETNSNNRSDAIQQIFKCLNLFYNQYPLDGGCDEGIGYWRRAAGSLFECAYLLNLATDGGFLLAEDEKFRAMMQYVYRTYIGKSAYVNFADSKTYAMTDLSVLYPCGLYLNDSVMMGFAAQIATEIDFYKNPGKYFSRSDFPSLPRELIFLSLYDSFRNISPHEPFVRDVWLSDLQIMTARSESNSSRGLFLAVKGGNNGESHNHNDVGNFVIYSDAEPVVIDIGAGTYTANTFGNKRYELFNCRSAYHNVPIINGVEQREGKTFKAQNIEYENDSLHATISQDISRAYPSEAHVRSWKRIVTLNRGKDISVTENFQLGKYVKPLEIVLITCGETSLSSNGRIVIKGKNGNHYVKFDERNLNAIVERIRTDDKIILNAWRQQPLYRIRLVMRKPVVKGDITYSVE